MSRIFFDVDTQNDFMRSDGALYVPNSECLIPVIRDITEMALKYKIPIVASVDVHWGTDSFKGVETELQRWGGPFPDHCMHDTPGMRKVNQDILPEDGSGWDAFQKQTYDVFTNLSLGSWLRDRNVTEAFVYGVATDYCVQAAVLGLRKLAINTCVVMDAIAGVNEETTKKAMVKMCQAGAQMCDTKWLTRTMNAIYS